MDKFFLDRRRRKGHFQVRERPCTVSHKSHDPCFLALLLWPLYCPKKCFGVSLNVGQMHNTGIMFKKTKHVGHVFGNKVSWKLFEAISRNLRKYLFVHEIAHEAKYLWFSRGTSWNNVVESQARRSRKSARTHDPKSNENKKPLMMLPRTTSDWNVSW